MQRSTVAIVISGRMVNAPFAHATVLPISLIANAQVDFLKEIIAVK